MTCARVNQLKHDSRHLPLETLSMSIPIPAETPDPNIDEPTVPPTQPTPPTEPAPVPEQEPPGTNPPPREEPPTVQPPEIVTPE
jgi:hypothetical protein